MSSSVIHLFDIIYEHLAACWRSRRWVSHGCVVWSLGTCNTISFIANLARSKSVSWFKTCSTYECTQAWILYPLDSILSWDEVSTSAKPWLFNTRIALVKLNSSLVSSCIYLGSWELLCQRSSNQRSWLLKYAHSRRSWVESLFCCLTWLYEICYVEYSVRSLYNINLGLISCNFAHDSLYKQR
jgi:hypothetical protein